MSAVLLAVFNEYGAADRVRTRLVSDGFPTDRVELTAVAEPGRAGLAPAGSSRARFLQYFHSLLGETDRGQREGENDERGGEAGGMFHSKSTESPIWLEVKSLGSGGSGDAAITARSAARST